MTTLDEIMGNVEQPQTTGNNEPGGSTMPPTPVTKPTTPTTPAGNTAGATGTPTETVVTQTTEPTTKTETPQGGTGTGGSSTVVNNGGNGTDGGETGTDGGETGTTELTLDQSKLKPIIANKPDLSNLKKAQIPATPHIGLTQIYDRINPQPKYDEAKEKKRQKRDQIISLIGDGLTAISDMIFGAKGAKGVSKGGSSLSAATKEKWDKLKAEREKDRQRWLEGREKALDRDQQWTELEEKRKLREREEARADRKEERDVQTHKANMDLNAAKLEGQNLDNITSAINAKFAEGIAEGKVDKSNADIARINAMANYYNSGGSRGKSGGSGGSTGGKYEFMGTKYNSPKEYDTAVMAAVKRWNDSHPDNKISTKKSVQSSTGHRTTVKEVDRDTADLAADVITATENEQAAKKTEDKKASYKRKPANGSSSSSTAKGGSKVGAKFE